jgi:hypothetical protein
VGLARAARPESWGWGKTAHLLVGTLAHSEEVAGHAGRERGAAPPGRGPRRDDPQARRSDQDVAVRSDGHRLPPRVGDGDAWFAAVAKHYAVSVAIGCRAGGRGEVGGMEGEAAVHRPNAKVDSAPPEQMNRFSWYQAHGFASPTRVTPRSTRRTRCRAPTSRAPTMTADLHPTAHSRTARRNPGGPSVHQRPV